MKRGFFNHLTATFAKVGKSAVWVCTFIRGVIYLEDSRMFFFFRDVQDEYEVRYFV